MSDEKYFELLHLVRRVRAAQKAYFSTRSKEALNESKKLEKQLDMLINPEEYNHQLKIL